ncbi:MAG TPA: hypothetical protein VGB62_05855, partial [Allosphingosinicella sp.]
AANETVYLRTGTGTYAEADGINLLSGQKLVGGGQDLVVGGKTIETASGRPSIVTTSAGNHGVELAQNNSVSGFDIGTTTGAGISDGGGTVGTLTVSDVGKTGAGRIIDVDQGGTVNVTLNSAVSTGATTGGLGGAIDLIGLSGTFKVAGATTITGVQAGGGMTIGGSTVAGLDVTFSGMTTVSTGATTAIRFDGNGAASSLSILGGLDIDTTFGLGLMVRTGGDLLITGNDNTITSAVGTAVVISNANIVGVTLESVSSTGTGAVVAGIILANAGSGGFAITGNGSDAGSGGSVGNKSGGDGIADQGVGIYIANTSNVSLANMTILGSSNYGISGTNVTNFTLRDSTFTGTSGTNDTEAAIRFTGLTGTALFEGNVISGGSGDNLAIVNTAGALNLTIRDSASDQAVIGLNGLNGNDGVHVETGGTATLNMLVDGVRFLGARGDLLEVVATGTSNQDISILNSAFENTHANTASGAGGVALTGGGAGSNIQVDYLVQNSVFTGAEGNALTAFYSGQGGSIQGAIIGNTVGRNDGLAGTQGSSGGGDGISVGFQKTGVAGSASYAVNIADNKVYDIAFGVAGISVSASGATLPNAVIVEATVTNNIVDDMGEGSLFAFYALVGGAGSGDRSELGLNLNGNTLDASGATSGGNGVFLDQASGDAHFYFPGYGGSPTGDYNGGNASADLSAYFAGRGNVISNGGFPSFPGGVDAGFVSGVTGDPFILAPWMP